MWKSTLLAILLSPLSVVPLVFLAFLPDPDQELALQWSIIVSAVGVPIAYATVVLLGVPLHLIFLRKGRTSPLNYLVLGAAIPVLVLVAVPVVTRLSRLSRLPIESLFQPPHSLADAVGYVVFDTFTWVMSLCGAVVAGVFRCIARPGTVPAPSAAAN